MQRENFANFNGEDIELASRELSQSQLSKRGRAEVHFIFTHFLQINMVDRNYRLLGIMWEENVRCNTEALTYRSLAGFLENNKRLDYSDAGRRQMVDQFFF